MNGRNILNTLLLVLLTAFLHPGSIYAQVDAEQVMNIGRNILSMDDYMLAIQYFNQAIKAKPYLSDPYYYRALAKLNLEDYIGVEQDCSMAIERNKFKTEAYKLRGFARQYLGKNQEALDDYAVGISYNPKDKFFLYYKAVALTNLKKYQEADSTFNNLIRMYPRFEDAYTARARYNVLRGDTLAALEDLDKSLGIQRNQLNAWLMRADIHAQRHEWEDALTALDEVVKIDPQLPDLYLNRAYIRYNADDYFGAMSDYNYVIDIQPQNAAAIFNRGLLRYEVRDLNRATQDFTKVLELEPDNFHAKYNRALILLETAKYRPALQDFYAIAAKYPRFYQAYYAIAQCLDHLGDRQAAIRAVYKADEIVRNYVRNPKRNPLDRPTIQAGVSNSKGEEKSDDDSEIEIMERFNRLVTVNNTDKTNLSYNEKFRGKVQDLSLRIEPEPAYGISFLPQPDKFTSIPSYSRALDQFNNLNLLPQLYISNQPSIPADSLAISDAFNRIEAYSRQIDLKSKRASDFLGRGILYSMLKNYEAAKNDFTTAIELDPEFSSALFARAYNTIISYSKRGANEDDNLHLPEISPYASAITDLDNVLKLYPDMEYAWYNKGVIYLLLNDFTSALQSFSEAIQLNEYLGEAYYNRGFCYLKMGNKRAAESDLRRAGELGVLPAYNVLKRMN
ncbi:MAG: tetratricopeptide repeat protein [Prevotella sp.]|nr:tetratricopeptide repeat protein [Bacteroides sp.]MCM1366108.1 tetratricopeptide repeat protein [Prevotella sp.]MCM1437517.1 tetratricopeptide repeat protein [Prevotella sp.]